MFFDRFKLIELRLSYQSEIEIKKQSSVQSQQNMYASISRFVSGLFKKKFGQEQVNSRQDVTSKDKSNQLKTKKSPLSSPAISQNKRQITRLFKQTQCDRNTSKNNEGNFVLKDVNAFNCIKQPSIVNQCKLNQKIRFKLKDKSPKESIFRQEISQSPCQTNRSEKDLLVKSNQQKTQFCQTSIIRQQNKSDNAINIKKDNQDFVEVASQQLNVREQTAIDWEYIRNQSKKENYSMKMISFKSLNKIDEQDTQTNLQDQHNAKFQETVQSVLDQLITYFIQNQDQQICSFQDLLYDFKDKYKIISERLQIKWGLMMAHCKQKRHFYDRAAIIYQQILEIANKKPQALAICKGEIYHKLGIYYTQTLEWNKGISSFRDCLTIYRDKRLIQKYAQSMNNLGRLYLLAGNTFQAQACLFQSYKIKINYFGSQSPNLLSTLGNMFQNYLNCRNFIEAQKALNKMAKLSKSQKNSDFLEIGLLRKKAKLSFLSGELQKAEDFLNISQHNLRLIYASNYRYSQQYAELINWRAILKLEQRQYEQSKKLFQKAYFVFQGYCSKKGIVLQTIKRNIVMVEHFIVKKRGYVQMSKQIRQKNKSRKILSAKKNQKRLVQRQTVKSNITSIQVIQIESQLGN